MNDEFIQEYAAVRGMSTDEAVSDIVETIDDVANKLASDFTFGYHTREDIIQQAHVEAYEAFTRKVYDVAKPLGNFLYVHIHNRLSNLKRRQFFRHEAPCKCHDAFNPGPNPCKAWVNWNKRNISKQRIMLLLPLRDMNVAASQMAEPSMAAEMAETKSAIFDALPDSLKADFAALATDEPISRHRYNALLAAIREIIVEGDEILAEEESQ